MEDDLNFFTNGRQPQFFENGRQLQSLENGRRNQYCGKCKTTSIIFPMEGDLFIIWKMEDDLNYLENGRRPQSLVNLR